MSCCRLSVTVQFLVCLFVLRNQRNFQTDLRIFFFSPSASSNTLQHENFPAGEGRSWAGFVGAAATSSSMCLNGLNRGRWLRGRTAPRTGGQLPGFSFETEYTDAVSVRSSVCLPDRLCVCVFCFVEFLCRIQCQRVWRSGPDQELGGVSADCCRFGRTFALPASKSVSLPARRCRRGRGCGQPRSLGARGP